MVLLRIFYQLALFARVQSIFGGVQIVNVQAVQIALGEAVIQNQERPTSSLQTGVSMFPQSSRSVPRDV